MHFSLVSEGNALLIIGMLSDVANIRNVREELNYQSNILPFPWYFVYFHFIDERVTTGTKHGEDAGFPFMKLQHNG